MEGIDPATWWQTIQVGLVWLAGQLNVHTGTLLIIIAAVFIIMKWKGKL
jgi:hypothetical protein